MNISEILEKIAEKDFNVNAFVSLALSDEFARNFIVHEMLTNPAIMVYYHCYYVVEKASQAQPELFYPYWGEIAELLHHKNSYHRDFAVEILGNLTKVDEQDRFSEVEEQYFSIINDEKFMTGICCVRNLLKIYRNKAGRRDRIIQALLNVDTLCDYTEKQKGVLKADVLEIFDQVYEEAPRRDAINEFIRTQIHCVSPKTRSKARELVKKFEL